MRVGTCKVICWPVHCKEGSDRKNICNLLVNVLDHCSRYLVMGIFHLCLHPASDLAWTSGFCDTTVKTVKRRNTHAKWICFKGTVTCL